MREPDVNKIAGHYAAILGELGADIQSEGRRETPRRAAKALMEMTEGSRMGTDALARGVRDTHSTMQVNVMRGVFQSDPSVRSELFMGLQTSGSR